MTVTRRGDAWQAQVNNRGDRYRRQFGTKKEALQWEAETKAGLLRGDAPDMGSRPGPSNGLPQTLSELIDHVYDTHWAPLASGIPARTNAREMATLIGPSRLVRGVTAVDVDKARAALLKRGNAPATVNRKVAALSKAFSVAHVAGIIPAALRMGKYRESEHRIRRFTPTEEAQAVAFFEHVGHPEMADYVLLSLDTGLRQGELLGLRFRDCDATKVTVWGTGAKSGKTRAVPLTERARGILARRLSENAAGPAAFVLPVTSRFAVTRMWDRLAAAMELTDDAQFIPHILRHEFCSRLADRGLNAAVIKELAGHSSLTVTQRYIHIGAKALVDAIAALERT